MENSPIGVVGAGVMGAGLAHLAASRGMDVRLVDISEEALERALEDIRNAIRFQALFNKGASAKDAAVVLSRISCSTELAPLAEVDFVIENVTEEDELKKELFGKLDSLCSASCIFASNTSAIPIAKLGAATGRPQLVVGTHFMNPPHLQPMVELIRGPQTSDETIAKTEALLARLEKQWVLVNDAPGFVTNRVLMLTLNEAMRLVTDEVASPADIDRLFKGCFGHKMGPLETADLIGLDTVMLSLEVLERELDDSRFRPCALLAAMVGRGELGKKSKQGFYPYQ